jgi:hypothetical protein
MTITVSSDAGGTYGSIAVNGVEKLRLNADGSATLDGNPILRSKLVATKNATGSSVDFDVTSGSAIPNWTKRLTLVVRGVSTNGTSSIIARAGTASGWITSGYSSTSFGFGPTAGSASFSNLGMRISEGSLAANAYSGLCTIVVVDSSISYKSEMSRGVAAMDFGAGSLVYTGTINSIRLTTENGTDVFDGGTISVIAEG